MLVAQITDMHILAEGRLLHSPNRALPAGAPPDWSQIDTAAHLARAVATLNALKPRPDVTVITGDLVDHGNTDEYANLRRLLAPLAMPYYLIPGNHDSRAGMREAFSDHECLPTDGFLNYTVEDYPLRIIALDTLVDGYHHGELAAEQLDWLDRTLADAPTQPTLLMMHHPPFETAIEHMDRAGLRDITGFAAVIARHPQIQRITCGHLHRTISTRFAGTIAGTAPATAHQLVLNINPGAPAEFTFEPPGYQLHLWRDGAGLVTHTAVFGDWPGPFPYRAPG